MDRVEKSRKPYKASQGGEIRGREKTKVTKGGAKKTRKKAAPGWYRAAYFFPAGDPARPSTISLWRAKISATRAARCSCAAI
jgi:hypothetical protein